ncbi:MAG: PEP-CTERM sorting domain-containing protein [Betaproteobacteria bacterium]|nr:PEP-CTERM sorting domain-containing protein [Betaproteobacteria bacterium]
MSRLPMKQLACAVALSGACVTSNAAITDLGTLNIGATPFAGFILGGPPPVSLGDFFTFVLPPNGGSAYSVVNFPIPPLNLDLMFTSLSLFSMGADAAIGGGDDVLMDSDSGVAGSGGTELSVNFGPQGASQNMYLAVSGFTTGSAGGAYNGAISVTSIPEPEVWAMMLVGVGLVGFRLRNRSKRASASRFA